MSDDSDDSDYHIVREVFEDGDPIRAPNGGEVLHAQRVDDGLEVWFRVGGPSGTSTFQ